MPNLHEIRDDEPVCLNCYDEGCEFCEDENPCDYEDDGQPDLQQEYDDLYGYGPDYGDECHDSYDCYDEW